MWANVQSVGLPEGVATELEPLGRDDAVNVNRRAVVLFHGQALGHIWRYHNEKTWCWLVERPNLLKGGENLGWRKAITRILETTLPEATVAGFRWPQDMAGEELERWKISRQNGVSIECIGGEIRVRGRVRGYVFGNKGEGWVFVPKWEIPKVGKAFASWAEVRRELGDSTGTALESLREVRENPPRTSGDPVVSGVPGLHPGTTAQRVQVVARPVPSAQTPKTTTRKPPPKRPVRRKAQR